jgi:hypothetical protein
MLSENNFIKKQSLNGKLWKDIYLNRLWTLCLVRACEGNGQFRTSRQVLANDFGRSRSPQTVWNYLQELKNLGLIEIKINKNYTLVIIKNFKKHIYNTKEIAVAKSKKPDRKSYILAYMLCEQILKWKHNFTLPTKSQFHKWAEIIDKIIRIDKKTPELVEKVIMFATNDEEDSSRRNEWPGWRYQIMSATALRKHFEKIEVSMYRKERKNIGRLSDARVRKYRIPGIKFGGGQADGQKGT